MEFKLILKKLSNSLTKEEEKVFLKWYEASDIHKEYYSNVKKNYNIDANTIILQKSWLKLQSKIKSRRKINTYYQYAAVAVIIISISLNFVFTKSISNSPEFQIAKKKIIRPGTNKATLTLENGSTVALEKGEKYQLQNATSNGEELVYISDKGGAKVLEYNVLTIPRGGQFFIKLSDGTKVWLNSETQLKYPVSFKEAETRKVELVYGEAYFDISPSTRHKGAKFKVINKHQEIEVLGTEFNIKAYKDDAKIFTTLVEGAVSLSSKNSIQILKPSQQASLNLNNNNILISHVNVYDEISWKDGVFSFRRKPLEDIMKVLSRWYDIDVEFTNPHFKNEGFNGVLGKEQNIEDILEVIESFKVIKGYEIKNKTVILK